MKSFFVILIVSINLGLVGIYGQGGYPTGVYTSASGRQRTASEVEAMKLKYDTERTNTQINRLHAGPVQFGSEYPSSDFIKLAKKSVLPKAEFTTKYDSFLRLPKTGIVRLLPEKACLEGVSDKQPSFEKLFERCPFSFIEGGAKFYSFRKQDYVTAKLADLGFTNNWLYSFGLFNQGVLVNLGDTALEDVTLSFKGISALAEMIPAVDSALADEQSQRFNDGVTIDGLTYRHLLPIEVNQTYGLRVTAYKVDYVQAFEIGNRKIKNHPLEGDIRDDIIVAFRILEFDAEKGLTLLWKELQRKRGPEMKMPQSTSKKK